MVAKMRSVHPAELFAGLVDQAVFRLLLSAAVRGVVQEEDARQEAFLDICERMPRTESGALEVLRLWRNRLQREAYHRRKEMLVDPGKMEFYE